MSAVEQREYRVEAPDAPIANERAKAMARADGLHVKTTARIVPASLTSGGNGWFIVTLAVRAPEPVR
jgi:hypothetical protein